MATTSVMGGSVRRREDPALIQGYGEYVDDLTRTSLLQVAFLRSPVARAKITKLDTSAAKKMPGVIAVYTHEDVAHLGPLLAQVPIGKLRPLLADGEVNHVGEAVALVVARSRAAAQDAIELVDVDYDLLPVVLDMEEASAQEAALC
ncbi:MAG: xanthine dehydrogenase family protein molybdopterin-binding subunit, partial [Actinomycetota bacterium]|nr:xanthine dehydrogenase family protein molybdopterin-binding subunit [Actinomycetota bacterium]